MPTVTRTIPVQYGATAQPKNVRADGNLATLVTNLAKNGITKKDVDKLIRSPQLNDRGIVPGTDAYANGIEGAVIKPLMAAARDRRKTISVDGKQVKFTTAASAQYFQSQIGKFFATKGAGQAQTSRPSTRPTTTRPTAPATTPAVQGTSMSDIRAANKAIVALIAKAATQEPVNPRGWGSQMQSVVTFAEQGARGKGSLERFAEANGLGTLGKVLVAAARYGARSTGGQSAGVLAFKPTAANLKKLERDLNALYARRDANDDGIMTKAEINKAKETANGKELFTGTRLKKLASTDLTQSFRTELQFSKNANKAINLLYSKGNITPAKVGRIVDELQANGQDAEAEAVQAVYTSVSAYLSTRYGGRPNFAMPHICKDQRREVTRGVMRTFGASADRTERAINAL